MKCNAAHYLMSAAAEIMLLAVLQWLLVVFPTKKALVSLLLFLAHAEIIVTSVTIVNETNEKCNCCCLQ